MTHGSLLRLYLHFEASKSPVTGFRLRGFFYTASLRTDWQSESCLREVRGSLFQNMFTDRDRRGRSR